MPTFAYEIARTMTWGRFLNRVQVENSSSSKLEANKCIPIKFATCKFSTWTRFKNRPLETILQSLGAEFEGG
jgi:hypothetical protein